MRFSVLLVALLIIWMPLAHAAEDGGVDISLEQDDDSLALSRANELFEQGEYEKAAKAYAALEENEGIEVSIWGKAVFNHGLSLSKLNRYDSAIKEFKKISHIRCQ